jgi:hypothetical protein
MHACKIFASQIIALSIFDGFLCNNIFNKANRDTCTAHAEMLPNLLLSCICMHVTFYSSQIKALSIIDIFFFFFF